MRAFIYGLILLHAASENVTCVLASPQMMAELTKQLHRFSQQPLAGSVYVNSKFAYRFYVTRSPNGLNVALRGQFSIDYNYNPQSQKLVIKMPTQKTGISLGPSENLKSIEWIVKSIYQGSLVTSDTPYNIRRKFGTQLDVFQIDFEQSALTKAEVSILAGSGTPTLSSVRTIVAEGEEYLFLFD